MFPLARGSLIAVQLRTLGRINKLLSQFAFDACFLLEIEREGEALREIYL
jgi:hypothetical protein